MSDKKKDCCCVQNVDCTVKECKYHTPQDHCCAQEITVQNENAHKKAETFWSTFESQADF